MNTLLNPGRWAMYLALFAALILGYFSWERHIRSDERAKVVEQYNKQIDDQKADAQKKLADITALVDLKNKELRDFKDQQENQDDINSKTVVLLADKLHHISTQSNGMLIDPNAKGCGSSGSGSQGTVTANASSSAADTTEAGGILSKQLTELLLGITREADEINSAYISCRSIMAQVTGG